MKAAEKAYYQIEDALNGKEMPKLSTRTKNAVRKILEEKRAWNENARLHKMGYDESDYTREIDRLNKMESLLDAA